ncbi:MAG: ATP-binding protein [Burkholderiales bacterium]
MSRTPRYALIGALGASGVLLYLLALASANTETFARYYTVLLTANAIVAAAMFAVVVGLGVRLWTRYRSKAFGTGLTTRLTILLALMAIVPGTLVYTVSVQFLSRSIESWFNVRVDTSLESGLTLARTTLDAMLQDVAGRTRLMAAESNGVPDAALGTLLTRMLDQTGLQEAAVFTVSGRLIAAAGAGSVRLTPDLPDASVLERAAEGRGYAGVESAARPGERGALRMRVVAPLSIRALGVETRVLQVLQNVPDALTASAESVQTGYRDYQELSLSRRGLRNIYTITLTLTLLLALFGAIVAAFYFSNRLSAPLSLLAQGTEAVAQGDFTPRGEIAGRDELGVLTQSFSRMTRQLDDARASVLQREAQLEAAKAYLERILVNLSSAVMVFDADMRLVSANQAAETILGIDAVSCLGRKLAELAGLPEFAAEVGESFAQAGERVWQRQVEFTRSADERSLTLLLRGSRLDASGGEGHLVVCDDISELVSAQRSAAWGEVARRLAHEIKNPLTPIQLSAERLKMKLGDKLAGSDAELLQRSTDLIVAQVNALKHMVDDFKEYARTPPAALVSLDLNLLVREVLGLYESSPVPIQADLADDVERVQGDASQLRQVIHNLLQNAQDAVAGRDAPAIVVATSAIAGGARLTVTDNGPGFTPKVIGRAFEPYVTTKARGTGLGLAIVKRIVEDHHGTIALANRDKGGAEISLTLRAAS